MRYSKLVYFFAGAVVALVSSAATHSLDANAAAVQQQKGIKKGTHVNLSPEDYLEIVQLINEYPRDVDPGSVRDASWMFMNGAHSTGMTGGAPMTTPQDHKHFYSSLIAEKTGQARKGGNRHFNTSPIIIGLPDGTARGSSYMMGVSIKEKGGKPTIDLMGKYEDIYVKTPDGWRFQKRTFYEGKWGEPNVPVPQAVPAVHALREAAPSSTKRTLSDRDLIEIQQLVSGLPYEVDMNADNGAAYASAFMPNGTFACVLPDSGGAAPSGLPAGCAPYSGKFTTQVRPLAKGRDALARMVTAEDPHGPAYVRHFVFNHVIEPTRGGATGKAYVAIVDITPRQKPGFEHSISVIGRYDDEYVKTAQGWRISKRVFTAVAGRAPAAASK